MKNSAAIKLPLSEMNQHKPTVISMKRAVPMFATKSRNLTNNQSPLGRQMATATNNHKSQTVVNFEMFGTPEATK